MEAVQEESPGYPSQRVPSGARYTHHPIFGRTEIYEFRSTEPHDPRNCRIRLSLFTEENFGIEESASCNDIDRSMPLTNRIQVEENERTSLVAISSPVQEESSGYPTQVVPSGARYINPAISDRTEIYEFRSTEPYDPRNCQIPLPLITEEKFGQEESASCYDNVRGMSLTNRIQVEENERTSPVVISSRNL